MLSSKRVFQRLQVPRADFSTHCKSQGTKGNAIQFVDNSNNDWLRHKQTINVVTASKSVSMCYIQLKKNRIILSNTWANMKVLDNPNS